MMILILRVSKVKSFFLKGSMHIKMCLLTTCDCFVFSNLSSVSWIFWYFWGRPWCKISRNFCGFWQWQCISVILIISFCILLQSTAQKRGITLTWPPHLLVCGRALLFCAQCCTREHPACFDHLIHSYTSLGNGYCFLSRAIWLFMKWIIHDMNFNHAWLIHYPRSHGAKHRICSPLYSIAMDIHLKVKRFMWLSRWINERVQSYGITSFCGLSGNLEKFTHIQHKR